MQEIGIIGSGHEGRGWPAEDGDARMRAPTLAQPQAVHTKRSLAKREHGIGADGADALAAGRVEGDAADESVAMDGGDALGQGDGGEGGAAG